jgi:hypothetical protein
MKMAWCSESCSDLRVLLLVSYREEGGGRRVVENGRVARWASFKSSRRREEEEKGVVKEEGRSKVAWWSHETVPWSKRGGDNGQTIDWIRRAGREAN